MLHQLWLTPEGLQNQKYVPSGPLQKQFVDLCSRKWQKQDLNQLLLCKALNSFAVPVFCSIPVLDAQQRLEKPFFPVPLNARKFPLPSLKPGGNVERDLGFLISPSLKPSAEDMGRLPKPFCAAHLPTSLWSVRIRGTSFARKGKLMWRREAGWVDKCLEWRPVIIHGGPLAQVQGCV